MHSSPQRLAAGAAPASGPAGPHAAWIAALIALAVAPFVLAAWRIVGGVEAPLDDTYIFFQYARSLAHGHGFEFVPGSGFSTGCTSVLYPLLLVPAFWLGLDGRSLLDWGLGVDLALVVACAWLAARIGGRAAGRAGALAAPAALLFAGAWMWSAFSGLETPLLTLLLLAALDALMVPPPDRTRATGVQLWGALALMGLCRPEALPVAGIAVVALAWTARRRSAGAVFAWLLALAPAVAVGAINRWLTGSPYPNTALAKSALLLPDQTLAGSLQSMLHQLRTIGWPMLRGYYLVPLGGLMLVGSFAWLAANVARERRERGTFGWTWFAAAITLLFASSLTAVWVGSLGRYYHNVCALLSLTGVLGWIALYRGARARWPRATPAAGIALALPALVFAARAELHWGQVYAFAMRDIRHQQVAMADWISAHVPAQDQVLANDVGAIEYLTRRPVLDLVGLVTNGQVTSYMVGPGAVFERLEHLRPEQRPTWLAIYPEWLGLDPLLGERLFAPVLGSNGAVLGNAAAAILKPDWRLLGSGDRPAGLAGGARVVDEVDVGDLASEAAHGYRADLLPAPPVPHQRAVFRSLRGPEGSPIADGGRTVAHHETFVLRLGDASEPRLHSRLLGAGPLELRVDGVAAGTLAGPVVVDSVFDERLLALPMLAHSPGRHTLELVSSAAAPFLSFHHWIVEDGAAPASGSR